MPTLVYRSANSQQSSTMPHSSRSWRSIFTSSRPSVMPSVSKAEAGSRVLYVPDNNVEKHIELVDVKQALSSEPEKKSHMADI